MDRSASMQHLRNAFLRRPCGSAASPARGALAHARCLATADFRMTLVWQTARMVSRLAFAASLAALVGAMIESGQANLPLAAAAITTLVLSGLAGWAGDAQAAGAEAKVANRLRGAISDALGRMDAARLAERPAGTLIAGLQRHPEALASLVIGHAAGATMLVVGPFLAAAAILFVSWEAALMLFAAIPVMIVFFVLVGGVIHGHAAEQEKSFGRLAAQFADRIRTLPTILASHALIREQAKLEDRMQTYAQSTMKVLRVAFLNAGVIDFFSSISIAVLAVFLGLGHLKLVHIPGFSDLKLWQSLFILMIAPEFFAPFRRYAEQYHTKAEGNAAAGALDWYFETSGVSKADERSKNSIGRVFTVAHVGKHVEIDLPQSGLVAITGPSGAGKSTLLRMMAGVEIGGAPAQTACDWISTDIHVPGGTLGDAISWRRPSADRTKLLLAAGRVGLLDDRRLPGGLDAQVEEGGANLSGGQRMRIGAARMLLSDNTVFADEPTAKLDPENAALVRSALVDAARRRLVVVATHDGQLVRHADRRVDLSRNHREPVGR